MRKFILAHKLFILLFFLMLPSLLGLFHTGLFVSDDGNWMVIRFSAFYDALRHGQFPVRFLPRLLNGFGYPVSDFLYPLFMYLGIPIHLIGFNFVNTIKVLFGISMIGSGLFTFLWLRKLFTSFAAGIGALVYIYFPYHLFDLYKRGSIGEVLALCIVPFILWQVEKKHIIFISVGIALLLLAHNSLALIFLPIILLYFYLQQKNIMRLLLVLTIGLGLSMFFWLPALYDKHYTVFDTKQVSDFNTYYLSLSTISLLGVVSAVGIVGFIFAILRKHFVSLFFGIIFSLSLFLALPISGFVWHMLPLGTYIQFPFRFLSLVMVSVSFLAAYIVFISKKTKFYLIILSLIIISAIPVILPAKYQFYPDTWYSTNQDSTTVQNEYLPLWISEIPTNKSNIAQLVKGEGEIQDSVQNGSHIAMKANITKDAILQINTIYFPGWIITVDGRMSPIVYSNKFGLMQIELHSGRHSITAFFTETPIRLVADVISLVALITIIFISWLPYKQK